MGKDTTENVIKALQEMALYIQDVSSENKPQALAISRHFSLVIDACFGFYEGTITLEQLTKLINQNADLMDDEFYQELLGYITQILQEDTQKIRTKLQSSEQMNLDTLRREHPIPAVMLAITKSQIRKQIDEIQKYFDNYERTIFIPFMEQRINETLKARGLKVYSELQESFARVNASIEKYSSGKCSRKTVYEEVSAELTPEIKMKALKYHSSLRKLIRLIQKKPEYLGSSKRTAVPQKTKTRPVLSKDKGKPKKKPGK